MPVAALCLYDWFFVRRNDFSQNREYKLVNRPFESAILGSLITKKVTTQVKNYVYK
jgi:cellobiose-specific phosphotransferase system component IIA